MASTVWAQYEARLRRVVAFIADHLDDDLDLDRVAEIACLSAWHWHRVYRAVQGETIADTVRRLRLARAATELVAGDASVAAIARRAGMPDQRSFVRAFRHAYGQTPGDFRRHGGGAPHGRANTDGDNSMFQVDVRLSPPLHLTGLTARGSYRDLGGTFETLHGILAARGLARPGLRPVLIMYDDPDLGPADKLRSFVGVDTGETPITAAELDHCDLAGGEQAVLRFVGPHAGLEAACDWLYGAWLPQSGRAAGTEPLHEVFLSDPRHTAPDQLVTEIRLPLA